MPDAAGRFIELTTWKRRQHFDLYRDAVSPFFSVTVNVDVTSLWERRRKDRDASFFLSALFGLVRASNASEPLRLRLRGDGVWLHDSVGVGTTVLKPDETFGFARVDPAPTYEEFRRTGEIALARARKTAAIDPMHDVDDLVYHSSLPWLRFTSYTNAMAAKDSIPRVVFGKVFADGGSHLMPVGVEVHHALVDGRDVARFLDAFQAELAVPPPD